jgi:hypothetical protein
MDPNAALNSIRATVQAVLDHKDVDDSDLDDLADGIRNLDNWLSRGGFLPQPWLKGRADADDKPSHEDVWLGITEAQANKIDRTLVERCEMDAEHDDSSIIIYRDRKGDSDFVLVFRRDDGDNRMTCWQCTRSTYSEALDTAVRKINSLPKPPEKMFLVHSCGEAFDDMQIAADHDCEDDSMDEEWRLLPESEAM